MERRRKTRYWAASGLMLLLALLVGSRTATLAQSQVTLTETDLGFKGLLTEPLQRTFALVVEGEPIHNLEIERQDLVDTQTGAVILGSSLTVDPLEIEEATGLNSFQVTVSGATQPGHYIGRLEIRYDEREATDPLVVNLDVTLEAVPSVAADVNSKDLTLYARQPWYDLPFIGRPRAATTSPVLADATIHLIQKAKGEADVQYASVLTMRGTKGQTLPATAVRIETATPFTLNTGQAKTLRIVAAGRNLSAGEYNGTLIVQVRNQIAPLELPLRILIKDGCLLPLIVLTGGLALGYILHWWKGEGRPAREILNNVKKLAEEIKPGNKLQKGERDQALEAVRAVVRLIDQGAPEQEIRAKYDRAQNLVLEAQAEAERLLAEVLQPLLERVRAAGAGRAKRRELETELKRIGNRIIQGEYASLNDAKDSLEHPREGLKAQVEYLEELESKLADVPEGKREEVTAAFAGKTEFGEMRQVLKDSGVTPPKPKPGVTFEIKRHSTARSDADIFKLSVKRQLLLSVPNALVVITGYLFALAVGWVSIYVASDTFGADPQDYITLFLWGSVVETVRGQAITLTGLKAIQSGGGKDTEGT